MLKDFKEAIGNYGYIIGAMAGIGLFMFAVNVIDNPKKAIADIKDAFSGSSNAQVQFPDCKTTKSITVVSGGQTYNINCAP